MIRVAYLSTLYPSLSHTFIEREVSDLRRLGVEVRTFSVRAPSKDDLLSEANRREAKETECLLASKPKFVTSLLREIVRRPLRSARTLIEGQRLSPPGVRMRVRHVIYAAEAIVFSEAMRRRRLKHVHVHFAHNGATLALLARTCDPTLTYSMTVHGSLEFFNVDGFRLKEKIDGALFVRCISHFCRAQIQGLCRCDRWVRLPIVRCGIDVDQFSPMPTRTNDVFRILTIGRLDPLKGIQLTVEACGQLMEEGVRFEYDIVGEGPLRGELVKQIRRLDLGGHVTLRGAVGQDTIQEYFNRADVFVLPSSMEGLPVVLMEAMAKQLPVVTTWVAGIPELVDHERNGLLIEPGSVEAIAAALRRLEGDKELRHRLGRAAREKVTREFNVRDTGERMLECFQRFVPEAETSGLGGESAAAPGLSPESPLENAGENVARTGTTTSRGERYSKALNS